jgi:hypothetical protein
MPKMGKIQMAGRIGIGEKPYYISRRNLDDFLMG